MMTEAFWKEFVLFATVFTAVALLLFIIRKLCLRLIDSWARKTSTELDNLVLSTLRHPSIYWVLAIAFYIALATSGFPEKYVNYGLKIIYILIIFSVSYATASLLSRIVQYYIDRSSASVPAPGLSKAIINILVLSIGMLVIFNTLGISITPLITALGVGGLAVALALQDTLSNLFAGLHILLERPLKVGDYVKLDSGEEGYVVDIGWRTTRIRKLQNNIVVIPNSKLAQSVITNFNMPEKRMSLLIPIGVSYNEDPEKIEQILIEETLKAAREVPGLLAEPKPFVRFIPGFGDFSLDFTLICQVEEFVDQYLVQHELRKRIFKRFKEEGVEIPFPVRTIYLRKEQGD